MSDLAAAGGLKYYEKVADFDCKKGVWMTAVNEATVTAVVFKSRCKLWSCPHCAKINSDLWIMRAVIGAQNIVDSGGNLVLVTVTAHERHKISRAVEKLPDQWNKLRNRWQRSGPKPEYILIPEVGKRGHFHIHLITDGKRGTRWWKDNARASGFGYSNDESDKDFPAFRAGFYVGKYLAKQLTLNTWKRGFHRVRTSRYWPKVPPLAALPDWRFAAFSVGMDVESVVSSLAAQGYGVALADHKSCWQFIATGELTENCQSLTIALPTTSARREH